MLSVHIRKLNSYEAELKLDAAINNAYFKRETVLMVIHGNGDVLKNLTKKISEQYDFCEYSDTFITEVYNSGVSYIKFIY